jgi:hypothetical protein
MALVPTKIINALLDTDLNTALFTGNAYYQKQRPNYCNWWWSFRGFPDTVNFIPDYIPQYPREHPTIWKQRVDRILPVNFTKSITNKTLSAIFSANQINRTGIVAGSADELFLNNCDLRGTGLSPFMRRAMRAAYIFGFSVVLMDFPSNTNMFLPLFGKSRMTYPYLSLFDPINVLSWGYGIDHTLKYLVLSEMNAGLAYGGVQNSNIGSLGGSTQFIVVTSELIYRVRQTAKPMVKSTDLQTYDVVVESYKHALSEYGIMPLTVLARPEEVCPFTSVSGVAEIAKIDQRIVNYNSLRDDILHGQAFGQLLIQADDEEAISEIRVGITSALRYPTGMNPPQYITPEASAVVNINATIENAIQMLERLIDQRLNSTGGSTASGVAKAWDFQQAEFSVIETAKIGEAAENDIWYKLAVIADDIKIGEPSKVLATFPNQFDLRGPREFIDDFTALHLGTELPPHALKIGTKTAIDKLMAVRPEDEAIIEKQLDKMEKDTIALATSGFIPPTLGSTGIQSGTNTTDTAPTKQIAGMQDNNNVTLKDARAKKTKKKVDNRSKS